MKKIILLIILILAVLFVGKYIYDKQAGKAVTLGETDSANISVYKDQVLTKEAGKKGDNVKYVATIKVTNTTGQASSSFHFINMPVLYKMTASGQYMVATSVQPIGNIVNKETGQMFPLTGPIYVMGAGKMNRFTVTATYIGLPAGTYKVSLGASGLGNWSGYAINGGPLQPLPTTQTKSVTIAGAPEVVTSLAQFTHASSTMYVARNASGTPLALEGRMVVLMKVGPTNLKQGVAAEMDLVHATSGVAVRNILLILGSTPGQVYSAGVTYPLQFTVAFNQAAQTGSLVRGAPYKAVIRKFEVTDVNNISTSTPVDPNVFTTNTVIFY